MFVWNHFTNDARVLRECTALSNDNFHVDLVCIHDPSDPDLPMFEEYNENFNVIRVQRYPSFLKGLQNLKSKLVNNKLLLLFPLFIGAALLYFLPILTLIFGAVGLAVLSSKGRVILIRLSIILRMIKAGRSKKYDIYHANDLNTLPQAYISAKLRSKKKKLVYDSHEVQTSRTGYNSPIYGMMEKFFIKRIDTMIVENDTRAKFNEELYGFYPNVVHNYPFRRENLTANKIDMHRLLGLKEDEKILLYQGGVQTGRGLENLIEAFPEFKEGTLVFIGDGKIKQKLQEMVSRRGLEDKIKFIPKVPLDELHRYTPNAYLGFQVLNNVCFNHYSASSNKLFEYMMSGVPSVACSFPEIRKVIEEEKVGVCVDSHDPEDIARGVNYLLDNPDVREEMSKHSIEAKDKYNWEEEKEIFLNIYKKIS
ncbi:glycosyltransferase [Bacillus salacetis]|uniref:Glycosyltransferase n=1 Tax=Bacillus salacetis TaxID=2315464 RepID=A0A3A1QZM5_9BACI|nr:glycosyltransferase [Bacillus salacetis]RIW31892.1 glycosyltransferase [Bacillus salacetis]